MRRLKLEGKVLALLHIFWIELTYQVKDSMIEYILLERELIKAVSKKAVVKSFKFMFREYSDTFEECFSKFLHQIERK